MCDTGTERRATGPSNVNSSHFRTFTSISRHSAHLSTTPTHGFFSLPQLNAMEISYTATTSDLTHLQRTTKAPTNLQDLPSDIILCILDCLP